MDFKDQVVIITGGARGIGFGIARRFVKLGAQVVLFDIEEKSLREAVESLGRAAYEVVNVTSENGVNAAVRNTLRRFGSIHVVVQCAGITGKTGIRTEEVDFKNFQTVLAVNLSGIFLLCKAVLPTMRKQRYGRIINIASIAGKEGS
jgi:2-dehydro-3-deoxy-L-rhamnonate dehydrogenase (NAD+)